MPKKLFEVENRKIALLRASMVITNYIKFSRAEAHRHNSVLICLLILVGETIRIFVYKITENNFGLRDFTELIQTQKRYSFSLDKISILTEMLLVMPCKKFSLNLTYWEVTLCEISHIYLYSFKSLRKLVLFTLFPQKGWKIKLGDF